MGVNIAPMRIAMWKNRDAPGFLPDPKTILQKKNDPALPQLAQDELVPGHDKFLRWLSPFPAFGTDCVFYCTNSGDMKKIVFIIIICSVSLAGNGQGKKFRDIIGNWEITGEQKATLQILDSATIQLTYLGEKKTITNYKLDFSKSPIWFDFSTTDSGSVVHVKSLLEIVGDDMIKWQLFIDEERPAHFSSSKGELFYLKKTRTATAVASN
jgi:hypothetical protein